MILTSRKQGSLMLVRNHVNPRNAGDAKVAEWLQHPRSEK
jgi:hypothetical protein